ncbi:hypothetical protein [Streptomyces sp. S.PB5]|uniref:hypothetical protein n=1 Tax=Streptomyces sp. S.PB5 TaxID=3020844 RepID=UPI0025B1FFD4|nr:hypothetical protein [Streptomyces sp. S.PB5]MDN3027988.1 hypothetical protein [Streptomyces sp. S.PB5]
MQLFTSRATPTTPSAARPRCRARPWRTTPTTRPRLYDPTTARFLRLDPVFGGNCNAYDFVCAEPVNGKKYGKFGLRHIKDKHVGKGKRSAWRSSSTMMSDLKKALISGKWRNAWGGVHDGKWDITYSYWTGCECRKKKYTVYVYFRTTAAPDGKPLGVTV